MRLFNTMMVLVAGAALVVSGCGTDGAAGPDGAQGPAGAQGDAGDKGATGDQGPMGDQGAAGPQGDAGGPGMDADCLGVDPLSDVAFQSDKEFAWQGETLTFSVSAMRGDENVTTGLDISFLALGPEPMATTSGSGQEFDLTLPDTGLFGYVAVVSDGCSVATGEVYFGAYQYRAMLSIVHVSVHSESVALDLFDTDANTTLIADVGFEEGSDYRLITDPFANYEVRDANGTVLGAFTVPAKLEGGRFTYVALDADVGTNFKLLEDKDYDPDGAGVDVYISDNSVGTVDLLNFDDGDALLISDIAPHALSASADVSASDEVLGFDTDGDGASNWLLVYGSGGLYPGEVGTTFVYEGSDGNTTAMHRSFQGGSSGTTTYDYSLSFKEAPTPPDHVIAGDVGVIADGAESEFGVTVGESCSIESMVVRTKITHPWPSDLDIYIYGPGQTAADAVSVGSLSGSSPATNDDEWDVTAFNGGTTVGDWTLIVEDTYDDGGDDGTLDAFELKFWCAAP